MTDKPTFPIFDGHNDSLVHIHIPEPGRERSFLKQSEFGHIDLPRARKAGFAGGIFAIFVPNDPTSLVPNMDDLTFTDDGYIMKMADAIEHDYASKFAGDIIDELYRLENKSGGQLKVVRTADDLDRCIEDGVVAAVIHFEGAEAIDPTLANLDVFYEAGLRSLGLVWSRPNAFGYGVPFQFPHSPDTGPGLTEAGRTLVRAANELGIMLDLSHITEQGFWDVARWSSSPLVATHSNAHALTPSTRNLTDKQLDAIRETNGVVGLNFCVNDIRADAMNDENTPLSDYVRHVDYIVDRIGIEHIALGSDFDGAPVSNEIGDVTGLPNLIAALREHGYDDDCLQKICSENWRRVLRECWK